MAVPIPAELRSLREQARLSYAWRDVKTGKEVNGYERDRMGVRKRNALRWRPDDAIIVKLIEAERKFREENFGYGA